MRGEHVVSAHINAGVFYTCLATDVGGLGVLSVTSCIYAGGIAKKPEIANAAFDSKTIKNACIVVYRILLMIVYHIVTVNMSGSSLIPAVLHINVIIAIQISAENGNICELILEIWQA
jgi:hypothetical protein